MKWIKQGLVFCPSGNFGWMNSHAQVPTVLDLGETLRIFFSTRYSREESRTTYIDVDAANPQKVLEICSSPILLNGSPGSFDEHGIMPSSILKVNESEVLLYYSGWSRRTSVPYSNSTGLARSTDGINFKKTALGPILGQNCFEPYSATSPFVFQHANIFYMYYGSGTSWQLIDNKYEHVYDIKLITSSDPSIWFGQPAKIIPSKVLTEAITRPTVLDFNGNYYMWFCYRGSVDFRGGHQSYRIGFACSTDLVHWERYDDAAGITVSEGGWDSEMIAYPCVVKTKYGIYMFYNGNGFGESGFGYAILD